MAAILIVDDEVKLRTLLSRDLSAPRATGPRTGGTQAVSCSGQVVVMKLS